MKIFLTKTAGFCMGVRRAIQLTLSSVYQYNDSTYIYGALIHNPQVLDLLVSKGIKVIKSIPLPNTFNGGTVIIRAHGVPPEDKERLKAAGFSRIIDGTCPRVIKVQTVIQCAVHKNAKVVIVGDPDHPEVVGLLACAQGQGYVVSKPDEVDRLPKLKQVIVVAQTTQNENTFIETCRQLKHRFGTIEIHGETICETTRRRQNEILELTQKVEGIVVVGGCSSANTKQLVKLTSIWGTPTFLVETTADLDRIALSRLKSLGVTAGASTPNWMIKKIIHSLINLRSMHETILIHFSRRIFHHLMHSHFLMALSGLSISIGSSFIQGFIPNWPSIGISFFYIYISLNMLAQLLNKNIYRYNNLNQFYNLLQYKHQVTVFNVISIIMSLGFFLLIGFWPFILGVIINILNFFYSLETIPRYLARYITMQQLKKVPGYKTISETIIYSLIIMVLPTTTLDYTITWKTLISLLYIITLVFIRCIAFDVLDVQGDLIVGKEIIPVILGEEKTYRLTIKLILTLGALIIIAFFLNLISNLSWSLIFPLAGLAFIQLTLANSLIIPRIFGKGLININFCLIGILVLVLQVL